jgi:alpha-tubulin suppressor-like RCC1 family protein
MSRVWCWGDGAQGQLGNNDGASSSVPVQVQGLPSTITKIFSAHRNACAIDGSKQLWCWGNNRTGQLTRTRPTNAAESRVPQAMHISL